MWVRKYFCLSFYTIGSGTLFHSNELHEITFDNNFAINRNILLYLIRTNPSISSSRNATEGVGQPGDWHLDQRVTRSKLDKRPSNLALI
jgi:hypothetical protein